MGRLAVRGIRTRPARTILTLLAIALGVALIAGTFVLTDTMSRSFEKLQATAGGNSDVRVTVRRPGTLDTPRSMPEAVLEELERLPGVASAGVAYRDIAVTVAGPDGDRIGPTTGAPTFAWSVQDERFDQLDYKGRRPRADDEIAIGRSAAEQAGLKIGDRVRVQAVGDVLTFRVVGLATFGGTGSLGGAGVVALPLAQVQALAGESGRITEISLQAEEGVGQRELQDRVNEVIGADLVARTGKEAAAHRARDLRQIVGYLTTGLLAVGFLTLLVGSFVIFNTFSITLSQRKRELGLLRMIGASRRQVLKMVMVEALLLGVIGSVVGLIVGTGLVPLLRAGVEALGFELPGTSVVVTARTVVLAIGVGTVVTVISCLAPAVRATRVSPMEVLQRASTSDPGPTQAWVRRLHAGLAVAGVLVMGFGLLVGFGTSSALIALGAGALLVFVGVGLLSPVLVRPLAGTIGRPLRAFGDVSARIAVGNAVRSPGRTAGTAAALMVGVALVAFVSIFVNGIKASYTGAFKDSIVATYVVVNPAGPLPEGVAASAAGVQGVDAAANVRVAEGTLPSGGGVPLTALDPASAGQVVRLDWEEGSDEVWREMGPRDALVEQGFARDRGLLAGSRFVLANRDDEPVALTVRGTYEDRGHFLGKLTMAEDTLRDDFGAKGAISTLIRVADGADPVGTRERLEAQLDRDFASLQTRTREQFIDGQLGQFNQILYMFYALLALSVVIALFGIVNALALAVFERTRELGLLRAVGASQRQIRRIVRGEAIVTAVIGAVIGVVIGVLLGVLVSRPLASEGFVLALPFGTLALLLILSVVAGVVAAVAPARRAARVAILRALQYE